MGSHILTPLHLSRSTCLESKSLENYSNPIFKSLFEVLRLGKEVLTFATLTLAKVEINLLRINSSHDCIAEGLCILLDDSGKLESDSTRSGIRAIVLLNVCQ